MRFLAKVVLSPQDLQATYESKQPNMHLDYLIKRFKKQVEQDGILDECKRREYFLKKSLKRREKSKRAKIRDIKLNKKRGRR